MRPTGNAAQVNRLDPITTSTDIPTFDVLVVGGGNAGISAAARAIRTGIRDVAVIEPQQVHTYRPLLSYVGAGQATLNEAQRTQRSVIPRGCTWIEDSATVVDAPNNTVTCASGRRFRYRDLVLGPGLVPDDDELPGIAEAVDSPGVASNYLDRADKTWTLVENMPAFGHAVFTVPRPPVSCTGTTLKPLFLAASHWHRVGRLSGIEITLLVDRPRLLGVPELDAVLMDRLQQLGVHVHFDTSVVSLEPASRRIETVTAGSTPSTVEYDFLHLVPPFRGPRLITESNLSADGMHGLVDVDPHTFRHRTHPNIWAVGDGASIDTDPSGGGLRKQVSVLVDNIHATREGKATSTYDGYTVAPIPLDDRRLVAAEFDRAGRLSSSLPSFLDPLTPRRSAFAFDRYGLPQIYWHSILRGRV